ncbi:type II/IV secretion system protein, partial [Candidatus Parcubacteria bacterium]
FLGFTDDEIRTITFYEAVGCERCFEGYKGRQTIVEALKFTREIRNIILRSKDFVDEELIRQEGISNGMMTLRASGRERIKEGTTTLEEVASATSEA